MANSTERLERLITDELGSCCAADVEGRLAELRGLAERARTDRFDDDLAAFSALASETRYTIVRILATADEELCVCELDPLVDVSESAVSHALSDLTAAGLITRRKKGKWRYYGTTPLADALVTTVDGAGGNGA